MWSSVQEEIGMDQQESEVVVNNEQAPPKLEDREVVVNNEQERDVVVNNKQAPTLEERELVVQVRKLRYLGFVQEAVAHALVYLTGLYGVTKDHASLLRPGVDITESK